MQNKKQDCYLLGTLTPKILGNKLPSKKQVLQLVFYKKSNSTVKESLVINNVYKEIKSFWDIAGIPTMSRQTCISAIEKLVHEYKNLCKHKSRNKDAENAFILQLNELFDIAPLDVLELIDEDKKIFLSGQQSVKRYGFTKSFSELNSSQQPGIIQIFKCLIFNKDICLCKILNYC